MRTKQDGEKYTTRKLKSGRTIRIYDQPPTLGDLVLVQTSVSTQEIGIVGKSGEIETPSGRWRHCRIEGVVRPL